MIEQMYVISITLTIFTKGKRKDRQSEKNLKEKKSEDKKEKQGVRREGWMGLVCITTTQLHLHIGHEW